MNENEVFTEILLELTMIEHWLCLEEASKWQIANNDAD